MENQGIRRRICSRSACKKPLPPLLLDGKNFATCEPCRTKDAVSAAKRRLKRKRENGDVAPTAAPSLRVGLSGHSQTDGDHAEIEAEPVCPALISGSGINFNRENRSPTRTSHFTTAKHCSRLCGSCLMMEHQSPSVAIMSSQRILSSQTKSVSR
jgi:hypothetical protein